MLTGSFEEFSFDEIITLTGKFSGKLIVWNLPHAKLYDLHINQMILKSISVDQKPLLDSSRAFDEIAMLLSAKQGRFEFVPADADDLRTDLDIDLNRIILDAAVALDEFKESLKTFLDDPSSNETLF
ncbi:MAG: DUF4388 domain-containing protein [Deinococcota bacterium]